ncbi:MAG: 2,3-bisphosphoglycerate-independent phosphoglycerate mutase [Microgenomates group bacterium GW2011_GWC1_46_16]|uniref:2,3-bisphosphoglycerate-independent phosphoglycerate mutase n=2 Tax=Candidatus Collieribacteriota TaxID=1752725 RepID=A0A1F5FZ11_9BACT|nr:MAG: 2,3-bisphosphoglycerate-independent phosphoglycerate mutase [Microgenomates group bacterium GW2011_GWF1_46_12]KKU26170.1 MAG: 2,3-bisphosphoglycerate-independent phosphoglycerate mutase [Microgenomates group bacterium GW2011_GWC1_46_16]KKU28180.1 MAG: 2,3-bisphosphoglycerate-independent phosphoglycerate mutase [Microgenomates group bacterium GW2011_GWF2_46_18]KKU43735.1 MAG: 2,3-bisphosphoglycerate-independent phosphoglycerate mutase [Microgenomates group bacterium GW2011_GWA1_46_7]KKU4
MSKNRVVLVILDGWGIGPTYAGNAIKAAQTPTMNLLTNSFPHTELLAAGEAVGLPKGEDGNTETGHLNIGAGRIVYQDLPRINMAIASGTFFQNKAFLQAVEHVKTHHSHLHLLGLIGQGGVHSSNDHLFALLHFAQEQKLDQVYLHLITDGRDSPPTSSPSYLAVIEQTLAKLGLGQICTIMGRYFAMDRDHRWERIQVAYDALVNGVGEVSTNLASTIQARHTAKETDEFIKPIIAQGTPRISDNDAVIFFNYRIDRPRELTRALAMTQPDFTKVPESFDPYAIKYQHSHLSYTAPVSTGFVRQKICQNLFFVTMTEYEKNNSAAPAFPPEFVEMPLSRVVALSGRRQLKLSESEKERFVTYYFNGQRDLAFPGEDVQITPSPKVPTYDLKPEMSGAEQTAKLIQAIQSNLYDLIVINYANPDMVAHTGDLAASIKACTLVDGWVRQIYDRVMQDESWSLLITADHGNVEELINLQTGEKDTEHSSFPVPLIIAGRAYQHTLKQLPRGILGDIAPTILKILGIPKPSGMSGRSLL